jgi:hypothetical protein
VPHPAAEGEEGTAIPIGFALCRGREIVYFRIRGHLRRVGLARRALKALMAGHGIAGHRAAVGLPEALVAREQGDFPRFDRLLRSVWKELLAERPELAEAGGGGTSP